MEKTGVVAALGQTELLRPAWIKAALAANDRLKFYLTVLQAARAQADHPGTAQLDLHREYSSAHIDAPWIIELPASAYLEASTLHLANLPKLAQKLRDDLRIMARPIQGSAEDPDLTLSARVDQWCRWVDRLGTELDAAQLKALTSGRRGDEDSFHLLVMDLHKALNHFAAQLSGETIDGAHVWQLSQQDGPRISAFMRGLNRTRALKLDHPGLDTAATRDGERLLIQNDIGTNDAHVLVAQVEGLVLTLTYSDLHRQRFAFFQDMLSQIGAKWSAVGSRMTDGLNSGDAYCIGTATFECSDEAALLKALEGLGARIVFLIDWNRARKRLRQIVGKAGSVAVLNECARREIGHRGWLEAGGEALIFAAMEAVGSDYFRIGDTLDAVMGAAPAQEFLIEAMAMASQAMQQRQPVSRIADSIRLLLIRHVGRHHDEFALLSEHASFCHALAEGIRDAIAHGHERSAKDAEKLAKRAKAWERKADLLVMRSRERAERNPRWLPFTRLIERADDIADAMEEAAFLFSLIAENHDKAWPADVREGMRQLAEKTLQATQDHVKLLLIASALGEGSDASDHEEFIAISWRVVNAEQQCDQLLRDVRRLLVRNIDDAATLGLGTDFAAALESATDALLATAYGIRDLAFSRLGVEA
ncbi:DUF47 family protein [Mesorhizobium sp. WSM4904]|uniref:DUF47 domain-containing protein n=1 Tax=Mesorhizobium sp. WSM4904 TaxID=3038545 RepID=UPI00241895A4|nr:DUF47 family protein [Mesorhizobium sp. WSM4904]WFP62275.1 DUF47 family protein [Mesorhizobium sp. WSM4904]